MLTAETAATAKVMAKKSAMEREVIVGVGFAIDTINCDNAQEFMPPRLRRRQRSSLARCGVVLPTVPSSSCVAKVGAVVEHTVGTRGVKRDAAADLEVSLELLLTSSVLPELSSS